MINRRNFLRNASLLTLGSLMVGKTNSANAAIVSTKESLAGKKIGLQTYSLSDELFKDGPARLKELKLMGYTDLELSLYNNVKIRDIDMMEFKKMANAAGLKITSSHVNPPVREYSKDNLSSIKEFWEKTAEDHAKLGVQYLIQPGLPSTKSTEEVIYVSEVFNEAGKIVKAAGLSFGYHNHDMEFAHVTPGGAASKFGRNEKGDVIYDLFMKHTDPSLVFFELDVYWAVMGQQDPVDVMKKYADRIKVLHIKDRNVLGMSGMMNFEQIFKQAYTNGIKDYFVELERMPEGKTQFEGVKGCANFLLKSSFVK